MGTNCLLMARVKGYSRVPEPPARTIPFIGHPLPVSRILNTQSEPFAGILSGQDCPAPAEMLTIPANGLFEAGFEAMGGGPAQISSDFSGIDGVPAIVARPVFDKSLQ